MCLGCLVASKGLKYDSKEAQEFIQQAIGDDAGYCQRVYGQVTATYVSSDGDDYEECSSCENASYDHALAASIMEYEQPVIHY